MLNKTTIFIFGGNDQVGVDGMGVKGSHYQYRTPHGRQVYDGYFLTFDDPKHPENYTVTHFPDNGNFPCYKSNSRLPTKCSLRLNGKGPRELVIPTFDTFAQKPCTAILNMDSNQWSRLPNDGRGQEVNEEVDAHIISDEKFEHVFILGGTIGYGLMRRRKPFRSIYRLNKNQGWIKLESQLSAIHGVIPVPLYFYQTNNWANLDANKLTPRSTK